MGLLAVATLLVVGVLGVVVYCALVTASWADDHLKELRHHPAAIMASLRKGLVPNKGIPVVTPPPAPPAPPPETEPCPSCTRAPCIGPDHPAYDVLRWDDRAERQRRMEDLEDLFESYRRGWPTVRMQRRAAEREHADTGGGSHRPTHPSAARLGTPLRPSHEERMTRDNLLTALATLEQHLDTRRRHIAASSSTNGYLALLSEVRSDWGSEWERPSLPPRLRPRARGAAVRPGASSD